MADIVVLPQQGNSVEEVILLDWQVAEGDTVQEGDILCEVETDKATMEVESTASGTVLRILAAAGDTVPVKTPIVVVGAAGEDISTLDLGGAVATDHAPGTDGAAGDDRPPAPPSEPPRPPESPIAASGERAGAIAPVSPRARMRAAERGVDPSTVPGTGPGGRIIERDVLAAAPAATAAARAAGVPTGLSGGGPGGRVTSEDIAAASSGDAVPPPSPSGNTPAVGAATVVQEIPVAGVRKVIAERMAASLRETAQLTLHASADARALRSLRARLKRDGDALGLSGVNLNDMVMYAVARTLPEFPDLNSHFLGTSIRRFDGVDLGFAVDTPRGLLVPTVRGAAALSLLQLSTRVKELAGRALDGKAGPDDLAPATFTVTNLGAFGVERFTPVLNPPQVAILGVGSIELKAVETADGVEHHPHIGLSLTIDHQAVDGAPAARFLQVLCRRIAAFDLVLAL